MDVSVVFADVLSHTVVINKHVYRVFVVFLM